MNQEFVKLFQNVYLFGNNKHDENTKLSPLLSILFYNTKLSLKLKPIIEKAIQDAIQNFIDSDDKFNDFNENIVEQNSAIIIVF